jgi:hypothetical protein
VRGSGQGFAYNFGRGVALNPFFVGALSATLPLGQSIGIFAVIAYGILIVAALMLSETKGHVLTADAVTLRQSMAWRDSAIWSLSGVRRT